MTALDRPVRLRQVDLPALPQPHERHDRHRRVDGQITLDGQDIYDRDIDVGAAARPRRHGVPEAQSVPEVDLRERRLRSAHPRPRQLEGGAGRDRRHEPAARRPVERGQGPPAGAGHRPVRRPAAAPVHRPRHRGQPRSDPDGRALLGARPDRDRAHRGTDRRAARRTTTIVIVTHHMQQAARVSQRTAFFHLGEMVEVRRHRGDLHRPRATSGRRITSPAGSVEPTKPDKTRHNIVQESGA